MKRMKMPIITDETKKKSIKIGKKAALVASVIAISLLCSG